METPLDGQSSDTIPCSLCILLLGGNYRVLLAFLTVSPSNHHYPNRAFSLVNEISSDGA